VSTIALRFETLSPIVVTTYSDELQEIAADQPDEYWVLEHFLQELPEKWALSFVVFLGKAMVGYAILSRRDRATVHLHHFMLRQDVRGSGFGDRMMDEVERRARDAGACILSLKYRADNARISRFYQRRGLIPAGPQARYQTMTKQLT